MNQSNFPQVIASLAKTALKFKACLISGLAFSLVFTNLSQPLSAAIILSDDMSSQNYTIFVFNAVNLGSNPDDASSASFIPLGTGGNPDERLQVSHNYDVIRNGMTGEPDNGNGMVFLQSFLTNESTTFTPSIDGPIASLSFSLDVKVPVGGLFNQVFFSVRDQNGGAAADSINISGQAGWQTITVTGLTEPNFSGISFSGSLPLSFGFGFTGETDVFNGSIESLIDVDNFIVSAVPVPEPGSLGMVALLAGFTLVRRFRFKK